MKSFHFLLLATTLTVFSCKKDKEISKCATTYTESTDNDTLFSSSYIMAYPGSVWNYDNSTTETCDAWEQVGIVQNTTVQGCTDVHTTHTIVAHTSFGYISGINRLDFQTNDQSTLLVPLLATVPGNFYTYHNSFGSGENTGTTDNAYSVTEVLDSMAVLGVMYYDVIHVHQVDSTYYDHVAEGPHSVSESYYANHIGLIRRETTANGNSPVIRNLVSYVIGPH